MAKSEEKKQPRAISPQVGPFPPVYKATMHLELQKFGDWKGARQMLLSEVMGGEELAESSPIEVTGLDLSTSEDKALSAIQVLLDKTGYKGNQPGQATAFEEWKWPGTLPRLATSYSAYFEAYGLQRKGDGSYYGHQAEEALEALDSLTKARRIIYKRKRREGKKQREVWDIIVVTKPLISIAKGYKGLEQDEAAQVEAGQELPHRVTTLVIDVGPLFVDGLDSFFLLKPTTLYQEIRTLLGSRPVSRAVSLFIEWLLTIDLPKIGISKDKLAKVLRLDSLIQQRKQSRIQDRLLEAIQTAQELGYLLKWEEDAFGIFHFTLNPERMGRHPKWQLKAGEKDEEAGSLTD